MTAIDTTPSTPPRRRGPASRRSAAWMALAVACLAPLPAPSAARAAAPKPAQTLDARSVGTATNLGVAAQTLRDRFDAFAKGGSGITLGDLRAALPLQPEGQDEGGDALRFFIASPIARALAGGTGTSGMTRDGLAAAARAASDPRLDEALLALPVDGPDPDGARRARALLGDPGVPDAARARIVARFDDERLLALYGRPIVRGDARDRRDIETAWLYLIRLSWLGAVEAEAVTRHRVPFAMLRGAGDDGTAYWGNRTVVISEKLISRDTGTIDAKALDRTIAVMAHECGHAIYDLSGLLARVEAEMARRRITPGMTRIVNEAFAGVFGNRAAVAAAGYGVDRDADANLALTHDIEKNIVSDQTFYAKRFGVDTRRARAQLAEVRQVVADEIVPFLDERFDLVGDPHLALRLPVPRD